MRLNLIVFFLTVLVFYSAVELILTRHKSRTIFVELQNLQKHQYRFQQENRQLLLEQATWSTYPRIENVARESLNMGKPLHEDIFTLR